MAKNEMKQGIALLVIGGSAGSLDVILKLLPLLDKKLRLAIVIVLHRKGGSDYSLSELLASRTAIPVKEIEDKQPLERNCIYVAPPDYHLLFEKDGTLSLDYSEKVNYSRPSIDVSFDSASDAFGASLACLLLSGANSDGARGLIAARHRSAMILVQDPSTAESPFMPQHALDNVEADKVLKTADMADFINKL